MCLSSIFFLQTRIDTNQDVHGTGCNRVSLKTCKCTVIHNINCPKRADVIQNLNDACAEMSLITRVFCVRLDKRMVASVEVLSFNLLAPELFF